jgi:hypothetical protein
MYLEVDAVICSGPRQGRQFSYALVDDRVPPAPERSRNFGVFTSAEFPHQVVLDGRVAGSWRRTLGPRAAAIALKLYARPTAAQRQGLAAAAARYGTALGVPCALED